MHKVCKLCINIIKNANVYVYIKSEEYMSETKEKQRRVLRLKYEKQKISRIRYLTLIFALLSGIMVMIYFNIKTIRENILLSNKVKEIKTQSMLVLDENKDNIKNNKTNEQALLDKLKAENQNLKNVNSQISEENVKLQNSIKIAAMAGIKPDNYKRPPVITSRWMPERMEYIGKFEGTAYTPCASECGNSKGITYSGKPIVPGLTVAVDTKYWPIGTEFYIKGLGHVTAMDTGSAVKGKYRFDFAVLDKKFAYALGRRDWEVYLVKMGKQ